MSAKLYAISEPRYLAVDRFQADECLRRRQIVEQLSLKEIWHVVCRTPVQGLWEDGTVVKYRVRVTEDAAEPHAEPHAELKELFQKIDTKLADYMQLEAFSPELVDLAEKALKTLTNKEPTCQVKNPVKLDGELMTREAAIAKYEAVKDKCDVWYGSENTIWITGFGERFALHSDGETIEYELRAKPLKQVDWDNLPSGVAVKDLDGNIYIYCGMANLNDAIVLQSAEIGNWKCAIEIYKKDLKLAPASEQTNWIARQDKYNGEVEGLVYDWRDNGSYRITGLAEGWVLK